MAEILDDVTHLTQEIGPHPAGTEEEQQAALYLAEELQKEAGFATIIEDFQCITNTEAPRLICYGVALVSAIVALVLPIAAVPCLIVSAIAAVLYCLEILGKPVLSRLFRGGASQNVVAKYQPGTSTGAPRRRKVVLVANYDSGKVLREEKPPFAGFLPILQKVCAGALVVAVVVLLLRGVVFASDTGAVSSVLSFLLVLCAILFVLPIVRSVLHLVAPYGQSANNNAAGVSVLLDVARQVGNGLVSTEEAAARGQRDGVEIHGEEAAREAGVVPQGATLEYDLGMSPQESLAAAKAAIAALTGKPVADKVPVADISSRLVKGGGLVPEDEEASSVRFEVSETPESAGRERFRSRTMVSAKDDEPEPDFNGFGRSSDAGVSEGWAEVAQEESQPEPAAPENPAPASFERTTPEALQPGFTGTPSQHDRTPAWARAAQEKARANKPAAASRPQSVARSRYADAPAAHMGVAESVEFASASAPADPEVIEDQREVPSALSSRLAALRDEIEAAEAPRISAETKSTLDHMVEEGADASAVQVEGKRPTASSSASVDAAQADPSATAPAEPVASTASASAVQEDASVQPLATREIRSRINLDGPADADDVPVEDTADMAPVAPAPQAEEPASQPKIPSWARRRSKPETDDSGKLTEPHNEEGLGESEEFEPISHPVSSSPGATTAISPIDVSAFLDKDESDTDGASAGPASSRSGSRFAKRLSSVRAQTAPVGDDAFGDIGEELEADVPQEARRVLDVTNEKTQRVSSEVIQQAIQEASAHDAEVPPRSDDERSIAPASPIVDMERMIPQIPSVDVEPEQKGESARQVIVLPDVVAPRASTEDQRQRAPMAAASESIEAGTKSLLSNMLPRIDASAPLPQVEDEPRDTFGLDLPALGSTGAGQRAVSMTGSFSTVGGTGSFAPVSDELVADVDPEERYINDADDSAYDEDYTETGAFAGTGYVDMPKSRMGRLFGRFRSKKDKRDDEQSVREWVDVDENYEARSVGKARGDWSSFQQDAGAAPSSSGESQFVDVDYRDTGFDNRRDWNGGAFSLSRLRQGSKGAKDAAEESFDEPVDDAGVDYVEESPAVRIDGDRETAEQINRELRKLQDFRHPDIDTEVWFVALGADMYSHSGMRAFLEEHAEDMKGAIVVNLEALGAGTLSCLEREGAFKAYRPSSRVKRFLRQASERSGVAYRTDVLASRETPASLAMAQGIQALTVAGMGDGNTALYSADNDVIENLDPDALQDASNFVMAILKSV